MAMGIKCSLLGHAYGETTVERDREEDGNEVVITIREVETCRRCGKARIVSENKEVTAIETPDEVGAGEDPDRERSEETTTDASVGAEIVDAEAGEPVSTAEPDESEPAAGSATDEEGADDVDAEEEGPPVEDDAVILEEDDPDRDPGQWPEDADSGSVEAEDGIERFDDRDDEETDETAEVLTDETTEEASAEPADDESESIEDSEVWTEPDPDLEGERTGPTLTVPDGQFRCPECGFTTPVESSSLREGDFCPECHQGTLVHEAG